ncbi:hypothetical protein [Pseudolactococcus hodotermopsidis]|nr:hypothetical protein [Lactococcus hodotermopsidis]
MKNWTQPFGRRERFFMLDAAVVRYDETPGILFQHGMIKDGFIIIEKKGSDFFGLPNGQEVTFELESIDDGLLPYLDLLFEKDGKKVIFSEATSKTLTFLVPEYDWFTVRIRMTGSGQTRLLSVNAHLTDS